MIITTENTNMSQDKSMNIIVDCAFWNIIIGVNSRRGCVIILTEHTMLSNDNIGYM